MSKDNKPLYIFDLDGTLADVTHRRHHVERSPKNWSAFYQACEQDTPKRDVVLTLQMLQQAGAEVWVFSGRSDEVYDKTVRWLSENVGLHPVMNRTPGRPLLDTFTTPWLKMRPADDYVADTLLKEKWLLEMSTGDRARLVCVFDDRQSVVDMWRRHGVACFQLAPGNF